MAKVIEADTQSVWTTMERQALLTVAAIGGMTGLVTYALYAVLLEFVLEPILCNDSVALVSCDGSMTIANVIAILVGSTVALVFLVRERVYRPLMVVLAVALALGTLLAVVATISWWIAALAVVVLYALAYVVFTWLAQPSNLIAAVTASVVVVALSRLVLAI